MLVKFNNKLISEREYQENILNIALEKKIEQIFYNYLDRYYPKLDNEENDFKLTRELFERFKEQEDTKDIKEFCLSEVSEPLKHPKPLPKTESSPLFYEKLLKSFQNPALLSKFRGEVSRNTCTD